jgi:hypothetical protein
MKTIRRINVGSAVLYGAVLAALWTLAVGIVYWMLGWLFGAQSWFIDMNLEIWTKFTFGTFVSIFGRMIVNGIGGAFAGLIIALVYNAVAGIMGGIKLVVE